MTVCTDCGGTVIEYDAAAGNGFCVNCGTVVEENTIVNEVTFGETSTGAAMVQGSFVGQGATHARMSGPFGHRGSSESREQTIANASRKIQQIAHHFRLSEVVVLAATRIYTLALEHRFTRGRRSMNVVAVCIYVACRQKETRNYMLIDFSDLLQVNVFELGHTYLQLVRTLNLRLPPIDPSHHISRFAALLEFGEETARVALDATRLVARMDRDWLTRGRRPAGICGAALLLAARMNNFRRSILEVVQVVKIADTTVRKRLEEFKKTGSAALSVDDFRNVWLEEESEPPAFVRGREKEEKEREKESEEVEAEGAGEPGMSKEKEKRGKKRKRKRDEGESEKLQQETLLAQPKSLAEPSNQDGPSTVEEAIQNQPIIDPILFNQGILAGTTEPLFLPDDDEESDPRPMNLDPSLPDTSSQPLPPSLTLVAAAPYSKSSEESTELEASLDAVLAEEVSEFLTTTQGSKLSGALDHAEAQRVADYTGDEELEGLDEEELDAFILTEEEAKIKERVWVEMNRDYLEILAAKTQAEELGGETEKKKRKKRRSSHGNKARDASNAHGATASDSVRKLIKKNPKYSKRINYDALRDLLDGSGHEVPMLDEKEDGGDAMGLWTMGPDKDEDMTEEANVIEEGGGAVGMLPKPGVQQKQKQPLLEIVQDEGEVDAMGEDDTGEGVEDAYYDEEGDDKGDDYGGWDVYEQEV